MPSLSTPPAQRPRTGAGAPVHRADATPSQLDIIAETNARAARQHRGRHALQVAVVGGALLLGVALWWSMQGDAARAPAPPLPAAAVPAATRANRPAALAPATPATRASAVPAVPDPAAAAVAVQGSLPASAPPQVTGVPLAEAAAADDRARKARARRDAEARAAALLMQQERLRVEAEARQQREAEREAQQARELVDAASRRAAEQAAAPAQPAAEPRRGVREQCSANRNIFSELFCHSRECRKPEHANDAVCIQLREIDEAQRRGSQ